ncbi:hypothetical protein [Nocardia sp. alder85J]|uniref:hypothetical protein n=1 Tax=Nocardia sp. alder85J TaxID=2862949 RepID=UPI001CD3DF88|nr:hypothetical protein [Nocardia sp. alder85J]MCX4094072.1 hypothetical protein [Nocardia sp. alder85J]
MSWWRRSRTHPEGRPHGADVLEIFGPSRKHVHERKEWVAVAKADDRISGDEPVVDLTTGVATMPARPAPAPPDS